jgi:hypothetical protein
MSKHFQHNNDFIRLPVNNPTLNNMLMRYPDTLTLQFVQGTKRIIITESSNGHVREEWTMKESITCTFKYNRNCD